MKRAFDAQEIDETLVENAEETHFIFKMDNFATVGLQGENHVKYADVKSGEEGITMMVRLTR